MIKVGVALPQMATGLDAGRMREWCAGIDDGPFSSVSAGERITFHNLDGFTLCSAAAALTERVRVLVNVAVLPWHAPALVAKELASLDVVSNGRVEVAVGRDVAVRLHGVEQAVGGEFVVRMEISVPASARRGGGFAGHGVEQGGVDQGNHE